MHFLLDDRRYNILVHIGRQLSFGILIQIEVEISPSDIKIDTMRASG